MLKLGYLDTKGSITQTEWEEDVKRHASFAQLLFQGEPRYINDLGWLDPDEWAGDAELGRIEAIAKEICKNADVFVVVGVGGSNNAARAVITALQRPQTPQIIYMGNTLSAYSLSKALGGLNGREVYIDCIAKNFETLEPGASFRLLRKYLTDANGDDANQRVIVTGTPGSSLEALSRKHQWRFMTFPPNIGGRFSALSDVGLLPMAVAGIDTPKLVAGAKKMRKQLLESDPQENTALRYACLRNLLYKKGYKVEMLSAFEPQFKYFFKWWMQLFAESEGKDGKGLFPMTADYSEDLHSIGQYVQDGEPILFETFLDVLTPNANLAPKSDGVDDGFDYLNGKDFWGINKIAFESTRMAHCRKLPCLTLELDALDEETFGALLYFYHCVCYLSGSILGIHPFNQPGVEAYKSYMFQALGK